MAMLFESLAAIAWVFYDEADEDSYVLRFPAEAGVEDALKLKDVYGLI